MADIILAEDNSDLVKKAAEAAIKRALEIVGGKVENYAKNELTRPKSGHKSGIDPRPNVDTGALRNNINHRVEGHTVLVGSNIFYAPYIELGTGKDYQPPPEWIEANADRGSGIATSSNIAWPFLRPAVENHLEEYNKIIENELRKG